VSRGPALWATVAAVALINVGLATAIVAAMGFPGWAPLWVGLVLVVAGLAAAAGAVQRWRQYVVQVRERRA
jgi:hypothetical protein